MRLCPFFWSSIRRFSSLTGPNPRNLPLPRKGVRLEDMTTEEKYALHQRRKHAPRVPSKIRLQKRILVLDRAEDIPREMAKLKDAMFAGRHTVSSSVLQSHWRSLLNCAFEDMFGERFRKRRRPSPGRSRTISHIGMPLAKPAMVWTPEKLDQMEQIFGFIDKHFHLNCVNYTTMMNTYERVGQPEKTIALYEKMIQEGIRPDVLCLNSLLKAYGATKNSVEAVQVLDKMVQWNVKPDIVTYTNLIHIFAREGDVDAMMSVYALLDTQNIQPTVVTIATLVDGLCKARRLREAVVVFQDSKDRGIKLNDFAYNALVQGVSRKGDISLARKLLQNMADEGIQPNFLTFKALVNAIVVSGQYNDMLNLHSAVSQNQFGSVTPSEEYYNCLLNALGNSYSPNYAAGIQLFKEAVMEGHFTKVSSQGKDRFQLTSLYIGCVPFAVQSILHSYIDRTYVENPTSSSPRIPLKGVTKRGVIFLCGSPEKRRPFSQVQLRRPTDKLEFHLAQETNTVHQRVEATLQFMKVPHTVLEDEKMVRIIILESDLKRWVLGYHRTRMTKPGPDGGAEQVFYVYKPGIRVDMRAKDYGPRSDTLKKPDVKLLTLPRRPPAPANDSKQQKPPKDEPKKAWA